MQIQQFQNPQFSSYTPQTAAEQAANQAAYRQRQLLFAKAKATRAAYDPSKPNNFDPDVYQHVLQESAPLGTLTLDEMQDPIRFRASELGATVAAGQAMRGAEALGMELPKFGREATVVTTPVETPATTPAPSNEPWDQPMPVNGTGKYAPGSKESSATSSPSLLAQNPEAPSQEQAVRVTASAAPASPSPTIEQMYPGVEPADVKRTIVPGSTYAPENMLGSMKPKSATGAAYAVEDANLATDLAANLSVKGKDPRFKGSIAAGLMQSGMVGPKATDEQIDAASAKVIEAGLKRFPRRIVTPESYDVAGLAKAQNEQAKADQEREEKVRTWAFDMMGSDAWKYERQLDTSGKVLGQEAQKTAAEQSALKEQQTVMAVNKTINGWNSRYGKLITLDPSTFPPTTEGVKLASDLTARGEAKEELLKRVDAFQRDPNANPMMFAISTVNSLIQIENSADTERGREDMMNNFVDPNDLASFSQHTSKMPFPEAMRLWVSMKASGAGGREWIAKAAATALQNTTVLEGDMRAHMAADGKPRDLAAAGFNPGPYAVRPGEGPKKQEPHPPEKKEGGDTEKKTEGAGAGTTTPAPVGAPTKAPPGQKLAEIRAYKPELTGFKMIPGKLYRGEGGDVLKLESIGADGQPVWGTPKESDYFTPKTQQDKFDEAKAKRVAAEKASREKKAAKAKAPAATPGETPAVGTKRNDGKVWTGMRWL